MKDLTQKDLLQISELGIDNTLIQQQIENFKSGFPFLRLSRPATPGDGIHIFSSDMQELYKNHFEKNAGKYRVEKFVPASGAATRMFKHLYEFRERFANHAEYFQDFLEDQTLYSAYRFFGQLSSFAFLEDLKSVMARDGITLAQLLIKHDFRTILDYILLNNGLGYGDLPKALIKFHQYGHISRVAAEEHLVEAASFATDYQGIARVHFTLSPEHIEKFNNVISKVLPDYEEKYQVKYQISLSIQDKATDTIAVDEQNVPFRKEDGKLLFRPSGHGALLSNLNKIDSDIIFIKNIDNIIQEGQAQTSVANKKLLGGYLIYIMETVHGFLRKAEACEVTESNIEQILLFLEDTFFFKVSKDPTNLKKRSLGQQTKILSYLLNRPIRVCGMVKNEGEPGGGPFWVKDNIGDDWLEIVESSQIDFSNEYQRDILGRSTHFNPVDIVCCIKDYKGKPFNLQNFVNRETGFISTKSSGGKTLKAQELP
ncbi:MAG: DUF4301 family protein, partial [Bacteroidota bacterium]